MEALVLEGEMGAASKNPRIRLRPFSGESMDDYATVLEGSEMGRLVMSAPDWQEAVTEGLSSPYRLAYLVYLSDSGEIAGRCDARGIGNDRWELGIDLLETGRRKGLEAETLSTLMDTLMLERGQHAFLMRIAPDQAASIRLARSLGGYPAGISRSPLITDKEREATFEKTHAWFADKVDPALAEEFGVEPKSLITHVLIFNIDWDGVCEKDERVTEAPGQ